MENWRKDMLAGWQARFQTDVWILVGLEFENIVYGLKCLLYRM
jgi:hypothetical protein